MGTLEHPPKETFLCLKGPMLSQDLGVAEGIGASQLRMTPKPLQAMLLRDMHAFLLIQILRGCLCSVELSSDFHWLL